jgi:branched-subunit amino acid transport protein AzlD
VLNQTDDAWLFVFGVLALSLTLAGTRHAVLVTILFATATAFGYGLLASFSDLLFGFWGTAILVLLPLFALLAHLLRRAVPALGRWLAAQFLLFAVIYPCLAGLDWDRQTLYLNLCALTFLAFTSWLLVKNLMEDKTVPTAAAPA